MSDTIVVEQAQTETTPQVGVKKKNTSGDLILDIAHEVESYSKTKALNEAEKLAENVEVSYFKLGGVLKRIKDQSWYEGFATFEEFVTEKYGFQGRKAFYLISIYDNLVTKMIPWEKVHHLGWTKLKDLAPHLTQENVDEWAEKAKNLTVLELQKLLKPQAAEGEKNLKTTDEFVKVSYKFKPDQADIVTQAIAKAKGELHTDFDTVALENICAGYVGGITSAAKPVDPNNLKETVESVGFETFLGQLADLYPEWDIEVKPAKAATATA